MHIHQNMLVAYAHACLLYDCLVGGAINKHKEFQDLE